jgi:hypothetical protein
MTRRSRELAYLIVTAIITTLLPTPMIGEMSR